MESTDQRDFQRTIDTRRRSGVLQTLRGFRQKHEQVANTVAHEQMMREQIRISEENGDKQEEITQTLQELRGKGVRPNEIQRIDVHQSKNLLDEQEEKGVENALKSFEPAQPEPANVRRMTDTEAYRRLQERIAQGKQQAQASAERSQEQMTAYTRPTEVVETPVPLFQRIFRKLFKNAA